MYTLHNYVYLEIMNYIYLKRPPQKEDIYSNCWVTLSMSYFIFPFSDLNIFLIFNFLKHVGLCKRV